MREKYTNLSLQKAEMRRGKGVSYDNKGNNSKTSKGKQSEITFLFTSQNKFSVTLPFTIATEDIKKLLRRNMCEWNKEARHWESSFENYENCLRDLREHTNNGDAMNQSVVIVQKIPDFVFKASEEMKLELQIKNIHYSVAKTINYSKVETEIEPRVLPFYSKLYDFQKESLQFGIKRHGRLLLADEMGVGKTIQSLAIISIYRHQWPFMVVCPSSLRYNWQQEINTWLSDYIKRTQIQVYAKGGTPIRQNIKALIVSYDMAWKIKDMLEGFKAVIADEAHYLKNSGNKRSDNLMPFLSSRRRVILLSGTPALAKPREIYNLISIVRPDIFYNFKEFGYRYCEPTINPWTRAPEYNGCQNAKELFFLLKDRVMIRRLKKQVLTQLPDKQRQKIVIQTDKNITKEIKQLLSMSSGTDGIKLQNMVMDMLCNFGSSSETQSTEDMRTAINKAYSLTGLAKLQSTKEYVLQLLQNNIKLIIFGHHQSVLDGLDAAFSSKKIKYIRIDGSVSAQKRHQYVNSFQEDDRIKVALLSITAAGVGLTLTAASTVVFAELHWTPGMMIQAEDRAHRIGQKNAVNCHYLIGDNTLDDMLYRFLDKKINNVSSFVDGKGEKLTMESMSKGQKGKVTTNDDSNSVSKVSQTKEKNILFKFQSVKPVINKYFIKQSQDTQISDSFADSTSDVSQAEQKNSKKLSKRIRQSDIIEQAVANELESERKIRTPSRVTKQQLPEYVLERGSSEMCRYIIDNHQQILDETQKMESDLDSQSTL